MVKESSICVLDYETIDLIANNFKKKLSILVNKLVQLASLQD